MPDNSFDILIIGAGPSGYVAAIRAAQLGLKTAVVERDELGGICLNWGCLPAKALLRSSEVYENVVHAERFGLTVNSASFDIANVVKRSRAVARQLNQGVVHLLRKNKVTVIKGAAGIEVPGRVSVTGEGAGVYQAKHIIVATGARPRMLSGLEPDQKLIWTYFEALVPQTMPKSLLIVGSGAIGVEFASFYGTMGAHVTLVEIMPEILPVEDEEIAAHARKRFEKQGIEIVTGAKVTRVDKGLDSVTATIEDSTGATRQITVERVLSAVGVVGNTENIGLERIGVQVERGIIVTDGYGRTNVEGIYAIGDVAGAPMLAHKASHEGVVCVEAIAGRNDVHPLDEGKIPGCTYCNPQVASVGLTERRAREAGFDVRVGRFPFIGNGKAIALSEPEGLVKTIFDRETGQLLGAHMVGAEVTELIHNYVVAMNLETTEVEIMHTVFAHPTLFETVHEGVLDAFGQAIHY
ncbi:dihydrolipoyl dehydrogenase [Microvirga sp. Mcv34]|uniref:dihydrolipoyl dehydrogenase n=1 Tax=Microvirga sp. Mcv34 TaxID=2926016 RepID=UPI0021CA0934|nr:dihydrolipoyl dehydrogenase [Microvirga sp. Mcv34]